MSESKRAERPPKGLASVYDAMGQRLGRRLFDEVLGADSLRPKLTFSKVAAGLMALLVHTFTLVWMLGGIALIVFGWPNVLFVVLGLFAVGVAALLRPRSAKPPGIVLSSAQAPRLTRFAALVADRVGAKSPDEILVGPDFNAAVFTSGLKRTRHLYVGLPLFSITGPQERVAVLAHELAHNVNGDPRRGAFIGSAMRTLRTWHDLLRPPRTLRPRGRMTLTDMLISTIGQTVGRALRASIRGVHVVMVHLLYRDTQRAEYLADAVSREAAGTAAAVGALRKTALHGIVTAQVQRAAVREQDPGSLISNIRRGVLAGNASEMARIEDQELARGFRLDASHPPTIYRIRFLEAKIIPAASTLTNGESEAIDRELQPLEVKIGRQLIDNYRARLFR